MTPVDSTLAFYMVDIKKAFSLLYLKSDEPLDHMKFELGLIRLYWLNKIFANDDFTPFSSSAYSKLLNLEQRMNYKFSEEYLNDKYVLVAKPTARRVNFQKLITLLTLPVCKSTDSPKIKISSLD